MLIQFKSLIRITAATAAVVLLSAAINPVYAGDSVAKSHVVEIRNLEFTPSELVVAPGDTVTWINYDLIPHTVTADDKSWDSGLINANGKWEMVIKKDIYSSYFCTYHPTMKAQMKVENK